MTDTATPFDSNQVPINFTLNAAQVSLILRGLGKLPLEEVEQLFTGMRTAAIQALQTAEQDFNAAASKAVVATDVPASTETA